MKKMKKFKEMNDNDFELERNKQIDALDNYRIRCEIEEEDLPILQKNSLTLSYLSK